MIDVLTEVLRAVQLRGTVYFQADFHAPWGVDIKGGAMANFHMVVRGTCWVRMPGEESAHSMEEGDLILFPHGDRHSMVHHPQGAVIPAEAFLAQVSQASPRGGEAAERSVENAPVSTLICGHFEYDRSNLTPLFHSLPTFIHLKPGKDFDAEWIATALKLAAVESTSARQGSTAIVDRLAEVLLIQVLRGYVEQQHHRSGFLKALTVPFLSQSLSLIHNHPARQWTMDDLAREVGVSRSVFAARFKEGIGHSPIQYLTAWRIQKAKGLLLSDNDSIGRIAEHVGYHSEWAFAKAFKRLVGVGPGTFRRASRESA